MNWFATLVLLLLPAIAVAEEIPGNSARTLVPVRVALHGRRMFWNGELLRDYAVLEQRCRLATGDEKEQGVTLAAGRDTSRTQVVRVAKILRKCGFQFVAYDIIVVLRVPVETRHPQENN